MSMLLLPSMSYKFEEGFSAIGWIWKNHMMNSYVLFFSLLLCKLVLEPAYAEISRIPQALLHSYDLDLYGLIKIYSKAVLLDVHYVTVLQVTGQKYI